MIPITYDMNDPRVVYDNPNVRFVQGIGYLFEEGDPGYVHLQPGQPGYVPPDPAKKKPFHRAPKSAVPSPPPIPNQTTTMSTFKYHPAPNSHGGYTTRVVFGEQVDQAALAAAMATELGTTPELVVATIQLFADKLLECSAGCAWSRNLWDAFSVRPTSGGTSPSADGFHTPVDIKADVAVSILSSKIDTWRTQISLQSMGEVGLVSPVIDSIVNQSNGAVNKYTAGQMIELRGDHLKLNKTDPLQGVFFTIGAAAEVRATVYGTMDPSSLSVLVPAGTTGSVVVRVAAFINGSNRSFTYMTPLTV